jgi:pimeloyl-ACP methyl ester carboxylesterase
MVDESDYIKLHTSFVSVDSLRLRVFYAEHSLVTKLPKPTPLIVFIHGLGGQINQFEPLLQYFGQVADVLALDLPGCGQSPLTDRRWELYTTDGLANLVHRVIEQKMVGRKVILVGHSLGTMITGRLALSLGELCLAVVLLCPKAEISEKEQKGIRLMTNLPEFVFNMFRKRDRAYVPCLFIDVRGGIRSASVSRMVGPNVSESIKTRQLVWNLQSQTPTTLRMLKGARPLTRDEWGQVIPPVLIIAGELVLILFSTLILCRTESVLRRMRRNCAHGYLMRKHQKPSLSLFPDTQS